jgi:hypothetical protein
MFSTEIAMSKCLVLACAGFFALAGDALSANITVFAHNPNGSLCGSAEIQVHWSYQQTSGTATGSARPTSWSTGHPITTTAVDPNNVTLTITLYRVADPTKTTTYHVHGNITHPVRAIIPQ